MPLFRLISRSGGAIKDEQGQLVQPYTPFLASPRWLRRHVGTIHRLPTVEEYRDTVLGSRAEQLAALMSQRGLPVSADRETMIRALLDGIVTLPDVLPDEGKPYEDVEVYNGAPDWSRMGSQDVRTEATQRGLETEGVNVDELRHKLQTLQRGEEVKAKAAPEDPEDGKALDEQPTKGAPAVDDGSWREPLRAAYDASDYIAARKVLKEHSLGEPENGSKKAVLHAAALALGLED